MFLKQLDQFMLQYYSYIRVLAIKIFIALSERAWKNKPIGRLLLYSISSGSEVIRKNVQNINCWFSTTCDVIGWVSMFIE
jgi:hypothetical protein